MPIAIVFIIGIGVMIPIVAIVSAAVKEAYCETLNTRLKMKMLDKGYSPSEIERILRANDSSKSPSSEPFYSHGTPQPPVKSANY